MISAMSRPLATNAGPPCKVLGKVFRRIQQVFEEERVLSVEVRSVALNRCRSQALLQKFSRLSEALAIFQGRYRVLPSRPTHTYQGKGKGYKKCSKGTYKPAMTAFGLEEYMPERFSRRSVIASGEFTR